MTTARERAEALIIELMKRPLDRGAFSIIEAAIIADRRELLAPDEATKEAMQLAVMAEGGFYVVGLSKQAGRRCPRRAAPTEGSEVMLINDNTYGPKPTDSQIKTGWPWMCFLYRKGGVHKAVALGLAGHWEDRGVTDNDLIRLRLVQPCPSNLRLRRG